MIDQALNKRLAELDPQGLQAKNIMGIKKELSELPACDIEIEEEQEETEAKE